MTRTQNSVLNFITGTLSTVLIVFLSFATRSVFLRTLGEDFLGIEGLFSNILSMLSLAELGLGSAIVFRLYKPIEENDRPRMQVLMKLYRRTYFIIGWIIVGLGVCLIPFLPRLIRDYHRLADLHLNAVLIFLIYLFNSASSYWFFAYKSSFVTATQKSYLLTVMNYAVSIGCSLTQIVILLLTRNFILYLSTVILFTLIRNLLYAAICDKRYPFLKEKVDDSISKQELKEFFKDCSALFLYRVSGVVLDASDNIVLSSLLGLRYVALYANYLALRTNLRNLLYNFLNAVQASLGSIYTTGNLDWSRLVYRVVNFCSSFLYGVGAIGIAVLADDFITVWIGSRFVVTSFTVGGVTVATPVALLCGIEIFVVGQSFSLGIFRQTMGLFQQLKYRPIATVVINLSLSLLLVTRFGIAACLFSTIVSLACVNLTIDPIVIHKYALKQSSKGHFIRSAVYIVVVIAAGLLSWWLCKLISLGGILGFFVHGCVCVTVPSVLFALCFWHTTEFHFLINTAKSLLSRRPAPDSPDDEQQ